MKANKADVYALILDQRTEPRWERGFTTREMADFLEAWIGDVGGCLRVMLERGHVELLLRPGFWAFTD